jgi:hypothetical protein
MVGKGGTWFYSANQGHIPVAACRRLQVRRIQLERYAKRGHFTTQKSVKSIDKTYQI